MICEIVAVGTELLLGQIVDTNGEWLGEQLALAGIDVHHAVKVGDNHARIVGAISDSQNGRNRATVSFSDSLAGTSSLRSDAYRGSLPGQRASSSPIGGGGMS